MKKITLLFLIILISKPALTQNLIASYPLNGNVKDELQVNNGKLYGAKVALNRDCQDIKSYSFDGVDDYIDTRNSLLNNLNEFSMMGWVNLRRNGNRMGIFGQNDAAEVLFVGSNLLYWHWDAYITVSHNMKLDTWYMVTTTFKKGKIELFINDKLVGQNQGAKIPNSTFTAKIGGNVADEVGGYFNGKIDDVKFFNKKLTGSEIETEFNKGKLKKEHQKTNVRGVNTFRLYANDEEGIEFTNTRKSNINIDIEAGGLWGHGSDYEHRYDANGGKLSYPGLLYPEIVSALAIQRESGKIEFVGAKKSIKLKQNESVFFIFSDAPNTYYNNIGHLDIEVSYQPEKEVFEDREIDIKKELKANSEFLTIKVWDNGQIDGDIISLSCNGKWLLKNHEVSETKKELKVNLEKGETTIILYAENLGEIEPNTAAIQVIGDKIDEQIILNSDMGKSEAIRIIRE